MRSSSAADQTLELLVFGDVTANFESELRELLHVRDNEAMQSLFDRVAYVLRDELGKQPSAVQDLFPRFTTLIDLVAKLGENEGAPVLRFCLMTVAQLAKFIHFATGRPFPSAQESCLVGVCTGTFAASAISVSQSVSDVVLAGVEATRVAFRTSLRSFQQGGALAGTGKGSWSAVVSRKKPVESLLKSYADKAASSKLSKPYLSASSPTNATLSGPPKVLESFLAENKLDSHSLSTVESPFHAAHLFGEIDTDLVMDRLPGVDIFSAKPHIPILSGSTGKLLSAADFKALLRSVVTDVLRKVVEWEGILASCGAVLSKQGWAKCTIYPFYCNATSLLSSYLTRETSAEVSVQNIVSANKAPGGPTGKFDQAKIAIVGYSGRFPEAASNEELWELLMAGRDVHREIPTDRFNWETYHDPTGKKRNTNKVKHGCFINEPGLFDTRFFNMSPREADNTDPAQRLAITATYEAMEMAGMVPNRTPSTQQDRIGVFFGVCSDDWREVNSSQNVDTYFIPGGVRAFLPGRIR